MHRLTRLSHFNFTVTLSSIPDFVIDWDLTWFLLNSEPQHDVSFTRAHASSHRTFKFKLFLEDLPTLEHLKRIRLDLYIDILTCHSCLDSKEDFMHLFMCKCRRTAMEQVLLSYQNHFITKLQEAGDLVKKDPSLIINKFKSLPCWSFSSSNWASYSLVRGYLLISFVEFFEELCVPRNSAMKVISAIHNHFIQKIRKQIWLLRSYDKSKWEDAMNITQKLKLSWPSNLPKSMYLPFSTLPPPTLSDTACDFNVDYLKNSMKYSLPWFNHYSGFMGCLTVQLTNSFSRVVCRHVQKKDISYTYITNPITGRPIRVGGDTFNRIVMESHDYIDESLVRRQTALPPPQEQPVYLNTDTGRYIQHGTRTYHRLVKSDYEVVENYYLVRYEEEELIEEIINETRYNEENLDGQRLTFNDIQQIRAAIQADQDEYDDFILQQDMTNGTPSSGPSGRPRTLKDHALKFAELNIELCRKCFIPVSPSDLTDKLCKDCAS
ncbi:hypothetical protein GLOIN_2v1783661 [Rhizophagus irregularis DAOM 181602=DAOM 197198]|nr:hypothetical protein GLOIN_2v1783661 [Rhizophagus irregularis DAOM 181602=DAOM 197198]